jgi:hypothetical protein
MRYEQQYALVPQRWEGRAQGAGIHPEAEEEGGHRGPDEPVHVQRLPRMFLSATERPCVALVLHALYWTWYQGRKEPSGAEEGAQAPLRHPGSTEPHATFLLHRRVHPSPDPPRTKMSNRKERRSKDPKTNGKSTGSVFQPTNELDEAGINLILKHPDRSGPQGKTLFELAEERQKELDKAKPAGWNAKAKEAAASASAPAEEVAIGPAGDALLYATSMAVLHLTLDVIVYSQYREDIVWAEILKRAGAALPVFILLVYLTHVDISYRFPLLRDLTFFSGSIAAGCYLVYSANKHGYFNVMKAAPPIGTLWIWSVIETSLPYALLNVVAVLGFVWYNGFEFL